MAPIRILGFAALLFFISCQKEISTDSTGGTSNQPSGTLKMKIDGEEWTADKAAGAFLMNGVLNITGIGEDKKYLNITLTSVDPGTYELNQNARHVSSLVDSNATNKFPFTTNASEDESLASGTVIVTSVDKQKQTVSGTFELIMFRLTDSVKIVVTDGTFKDLPYLTSIPPTATNDTLKASIDNIPWIGTVVTGTTFQDQLFVTGTETNGIKSVAVIMPLEVEPGEYELENFGEYMGAYTPDINTSLGSESGKLTVIEHNKTAKKIRGRFEFVGTELLGPKTASITDGYFSVMYK
jgi:hypothetical protein